MADSIVMTICHLGQNCHVIDMTSLTRLNLTKVMGKGAPMRKMHRLASDLINAMDQPFVLIDRDYRIVAANRQYCRNYAVDPDTVIGRHCYEVSHHQDAPCHLRGEDCPHQQVFETGQTHEVLHTHYDPRGCPERVRIRGHAVHAESGELLLGEAMSPIAELDAETPGQAGLVGHSPRFLASLDELARAASGDAGVLVLGESGVGKELGARFLHDRSHRADHRMVTVDCTTLTEPLFESELFGHEHGAFTGCTGRRRGLVELAEGGTLFFDEVGELTPAMQAKLLRFLETGEFRRLGGRETLTADVRVVAATNRDLARWTESGRFRRDLYYRLACISIRIPPLRERREDILPLAEAFLLRLGQSQGKHCRLSPAAVTRLKHHDFPGNIRELKNLLQRAVTMCQDGRIEVDDLGLPAHAPAPPHTGDALPSELRDRPLEELEAEQIAALLDRHGGHRARVADALGISERTLYRKLKRHGLR